MGVDWGLEIVWFFLSRDSSCFRVSTIIFVFEAKTTPNTSPATQFDPINYRKFLKVQPGTSFTIPLFPAFFAVFSSPIFLFAVKSRNADIRQPYSGTPHRTSAYI